MKQQLQADKERLIEKIQQQLSKLREKRDHLESAKTQAKSQPRVFMPVSQYKMEKFEDNRKKLQILSQVYEQQKDLKKVGINTKNINEVMKYTKDPKMSRLVAMKKVKAQQDEKKAKIIQEQMKQTKKFLNKKKINEQQLIELQQFNYKRLFGAKKDLLTRYDKLLMKKALNRIQKQEIIEMTFNLIREWNHVVKKQKVRDFFLANESFCFKFRISKNEIYRDLDVYETKQQSYLDYNQFYELIKSIEITNQMINPTMHKPKKPVLQSKVQTKTISKSENSSQIKLKKDIKDYLKKVFTLIDSKKQGLIKRSKFFIALEKATYLGKSKKDLQMKEFLKRFHEYLKNQTSLDRNKSYYKQLQTTFINWSQIQQILRNYINSTNKRQQTSEVASQEQTVTNQEQQQESINNEVYVSESDELPKQQYEELEEDFTKYGWKKQTQQIEEIQLTDLDQYYGDLRQKHANEIEWEGFDHYKTDFHKLETFINEQQKKLQQK